MWVLVHATVAVSSLVMAAAAFTAPSTPRLRISQALIALTIGSGTYLVLTMKVNLLRVCLMGLVYTAIVSYWIVRAQRKLAVQEALKSRP